METKKEVLEHIRSTTKEVKAPQILLENGKRIPFGWQSVPIGGSHTEFITKFFWEEIAQIRDGFLRITIAADVREAYLIQVFLLDSMRVIGSFDIQYAHVFQIYEIKISSQDIQNMLKEGIGLKMIKGESPLWLFDKSSSNEDMLPKEFMPHIFIPKFPQGDLLEEFYKNMFSLSVIQPFGWMEGCVLDGLNDLEALFSKEKSRSIIERHFDMFIDQEGRLIYENPRSMPVDDQIYGIEGTLPFAILAQISPEHPILDKVAAFFEDHTEEDGSILDGAVLTAEGSYTIAYPLAVLARIKKSSKLSDTCIKQLLMRKERLGKEDGVFLRAYNDGTYTFKNWARAFSWYMLGLTRSLEWLQESTENKCCINELKEECRRIAALAISHQDQSGLWNCFVDDASTDSDTSGSAGIAAALAQGWKLGILSQEAKVSALKAFEALKKYLTPDGLLSGVAQSNKNGEAFQRSSYRVLSQMAMGLMAQLACVVENPVKGEENE